MLWLNAQAATAGRLSTLLLTPPELIDIVMARITDKGVAILVDPDEEEMDATLRTLLAPLPSVVSEGGRDDERRIADEVGLIARSLSPGGFPEGEPMVQGSSGDAQLV